MTITPGRDALRRAEVAIEAVLEIAMEDLMARARRNAPYDERKPPEEPHLRDNAEIGDVHGFGDGRHASIESRFLQDYAAVIETGRYTRNGREISLVPRGRPESGGIIPHFASNAVKETVEPFRNLVAASVKQAVEKR